MESGAPSAGYGVFVGTEVGVGAGLVAGGALVGGGELFSVTVEVGWTDGDWVGDTEAECRYLLTRMITITMTTIATITRMMLRNVWSCLGGGP